IPSATIEACTKTWTEQPPEPGHDYSAAMDPATRGNAWTFVVADRHKGKERIVYAREWQHSKVKPAKPSEIFREVSPVLTRYGLDWCYSDQFSGDALVDIAEDLEDEDGESIGFSLLIEDWNAKNKY